MAGDAQEFAAFVRSHSRQLQREGYLLTGNWSTAEDLVQVALTTMWQRWDSLDQPDAHLAYARRVVMTTFLDWRRRLSFRERPTEWVTQDTSGDDLAERDGPRRPQAVVAAAARGRGAVLLR
jgi:DNA-directed RNA polymerase specialized sigma24 family protein